MVWLAFFGQRLVENNLNLWQSVLAEWVSIPAGNWGGGGIVYLGIWAGGDRE